MNLVFDSCSELTLVPLISDDDEESDAGSERVEDDANSTDSLHSFAAHGEHHVLIRGRVLYVGAIGQDNQGSNDEDQQNLRNTLKLSLKT